MEGVFDQDDFLTDDWIKHMDDLIKDLREPTREVDQQKEKDPRKAYDRAMDIVRR